MTKVEELKLLDKIAGLIAESGKDSYISMTFAGICDVCRRNITDDFGDSPVQDLEELRKRFDAEVRHYDETKRLLADAQKMLKEALDHKEKLLEVEHERDVLRQAVEYKDSCLDTMNHLYDSETQKLKAEIMRMRMQRMTDADIAELYDKTKGAN